MAAKKTVKKTFEFVNIQLSPQMHGKIGKGLSKVTLQMFNEEVAKFHEMGFSVKLTVYKKKCQAGCVTTEAMSDGVTYATNATASNYTDALHVLFVKLDEIANWDLLGYAAGEGGGELDFG